MNGLLKKMRALISFVLTLAILLSFSLGSEYSLIRSFAADEELQFYDDDGSIAINLEDDGSDLGTIWFDGENFYDSDPADQIGIEYPSAEWQAEKDIDGTDMTVTATIPAGAFDRRVGFYAKVTTIDSLSADKVALLDKNELPKETLEFFDIGFKDKEGNEIEPSMAIEITFRLKERATKAQENGDSLLIDVYHITEEDGVALEKVASIDEQADETGAENIEVNTSVNLASTKTDVNPITSVDVGGITVEDGDVVATFETDSFSTYVVNDESKRRTITFDNNALYIMSKYPSVTADKFNVPTVSTRLGVDPGTYVTLPKNAFTFENHLFGSWNTKKDGTGTKYTDGATILLTENITLYAQWTDHNHAGWTALSGTINPTIVMSSSGKYYLDGDVTFTKKWTVPAGETTLCLNGHKLTGAGSTTERIIDVPSGAIFNLEDCNKGHTTDYAVANPVDGGTATIKTGLITGGNSGAIHVNGGTMYMYGGTIAGNIDSHTNHAGQGGGGGGVIVGIDDSTTPTGTFYMYGGALSYNRGDNWGGGGLRGQGTSSLTIEGGVISYNTAQFGGGVSIKQSAEIIMTGGTICNNKTSTGVAGSQGGGGIHFGSNYATTAQFLGGIIENNESTKYSGGGIQLNSGANPKGSFILGNVIIRNNTAIAGGGIGYGDSNGILKISGMPYVRENKLSSGTLSNIQLPSNQKIEIIGRLTDGVNNANVGVTVSNSIPYTFTTGYGYNEGGLNTAISPARFFYSDNTNYSVLLDTAAGEAQLGNGHVHTLKPDGSGELITFNAWTSTSSMPNTAGDYYLTSDVTLSSTWNVPSGTTNLCLNGHVIKGNGSVNSLISCTSGRTLNITDCNRGGRTNSFKSASSGETVQVKTGLITGAKYHALEITGGTFSLYAGTIGGINNDVHGNSVIGRGAGVLISSGTFYMYGGRIAHNFVYEHGGAGVSVKDVAKFYLYDGELDHNTASYGGAVIVTETAEFYMSGGLMHHNKATNASDYSGINNGGGGAVCVGATHNKEGVIEFNGGQIYENEAVTLGGGIATDRRNGTNKTSIRITDVIIRDNYAGSRGGGVGIGDKTDGTTTILLQGAPIIKDNTSTSSKKADNLYFSSSYLTKVTGKIEENAHIGICMQTPGVFTTQYDYFNSASPNYAQNPEKFFISDDTHYSVIVNPTGEAELAVGHVHALKYGVSSDNITFSVWESTNSLPNAPGNYYLTNDVTLTSTWQVPSGTTNLCLDGHVIKGSNIDSVINCASGCTLNITDCNEDHRSNVFRSATTNELIEVNSGLITGAKLHGISVSGGTVSLYAGVIGGIKNTNGSDVYSRGGGVDVSFGTFNMYGGRIAHNYVTTHGGGAVAVYNDATFNFVDGELDHNSAIFGGGIIATNNGKLYMSGGTIHHNEGRSTNPSKCGGGICIGAGHTAMNAVVITGGEIYENTAKTFGGGISLDQKNTNIDGSIKLTNVVIRDNHAQIRGGGIGFGNKIAGHIYLYLEGKVIIKNNTSTDSYRDDNLYVTNKYFVSITGKITDGSEIGIRMENPGVFTTGYGFYDSSGLNYANDPNKLFFSDDEKYSVTVTKEGELQLTTAHVHSLRHNSEDEKIIFWPWDETDSLPDIPGRYYLTHDVELTSTWSPPSGDTKLCLNGHVIRHKGGSGEVINVGSSATLHLTDCDLSKDSDYYNKNEFTLTEYDNNVNKSTSKQNAAGLITGGKNGAIVVVGTLYFYDGTIANNDATPDYVAGGITLYRNTSGRLYMYGGRITSNTGYAYGGGLVNASSGEMVIYGGTVDHNKAGKGGAIHIAQNAAETKILGGEYIYNVATDSGNTENGGGAFNFGSSYKGTATIKNATFIGNKAPYGIGGAINIDPSTVFNMDNCSFTDNYGLHGGAIYTDGTTTITNTTFTGNSSINNGGAICINSGSTTVSGTTIKSNTAGSSGAGLYCAVDFSLYGKNIITDNTVAGEKQNVYLTQYQEGTKIKSRRILVTNSIVGSDIGISMQKPGVFTKGYGFGDGTKRSVDNIISTQFNLGIMPNNYFSSDSEAYIVKLYEDGCEATLGNYIVEYHAPNETSGAADYFKSGMAEWKDTYKPTYPDSKYIYVPSEEAGVENFYAEAYDTTLAVGTYQKANEPIDPAWSEKKAGKPVKVFDGWYYESENEGAKEYVFAKNLTTPIILNATWEAYVNEQSYVGGLVGYAEGDVEFSGCQVGYNPSGLENAGILLKSTGFDGYVGGLIGYTDGKLTVGSSSGNDSMVMSRLYGTYVGGVGGYAKGKVDVSSAEVSGYILGMDEDAQPSIVAVDGFIPYRTYAGVYVVRKEDDTAFGHDSFPTTEQQFKFYDKEVFGTALPDDIMKVVRPKHRFYQNNAGSQWTDPLKNVGVTAVSQP